MTYFTYDNLPMLTAAGMSSAAALILKPYVPTGGLSSVYDYSVIYATAASDAKLHQSFSWIGRAGATYDVISSSYFDPLLLQVFDDKGRTIAIDDGIGGYGFDHATFVAPYSGTYYLYASWEQGSASTNKAVAVGVFEDRDTIAPKTTAILNGTNGDDKFTPTDNNDVIYGMGGADTITYSGPRSNYVVTYSDSKNFVTDTTGIGGVDAVIDVERLAFSDVFVSIGASGPAAEAYRLYKAAFDRAPDARGIGYWIGAMERGAPLSAVADAFASSAEFKTLYGTSPTSGDVLTALYKNVLHRAPDQGGYDYWIGLLNSKAATTADMLTSFSESAENQAQVIGSLNAGFDFIY
ncbi:MAG: DUF4214 domain-containing protein [Telluria sp.]